MEQQRFASLTGRARQWLPPEEFEPELSAPRPPVLSRKKPAISTKRPLASVGDLVRYKSDRPPPSSSR
jgi:hypothetical protein